MHLGAALAPVLFMAAATPTVFGLDLPREMRAGSVPSGGEAMRLPQRYGQLPMTSKLIGARPRPRSGICLVAEATAFS